MVLFDLARFKTDESIERGMIESVQKTIFEQAKQVWMFLFLNELNLDVTMTWPWFVFEQKGVCYTRLFLKISAPFAKFDAQSVIPYQNYHLMWIKTPEKALSLSSIFPDITKHTRIAKTMVNRHSRVRFFCVYASLCQFFNCLQLSSIKV